MTNYTPKCPVCNSKLIPACDFVGWASVPCKKCKKWVRFEIVNKDGHRVLNAYVHERGCAEGVLTSMEVLV